MSTKLTLNLSEEVIKEAKVYAKANAISLSKLVENYLSSLTYSYKKESSISPLVESLTGIIPTDYDERKEYRDFIDEKYR
jgi:hypothetical protein